MEQSEEGKLWYHINKEQLLNIDKDKPVCIFTIVFPSINIYLLALLIPLFDVLKFLINENFSVNDIEIKWLLIDIKESEYVLNTARMHYKHLIGEFIDENTLNNILIDEFESEVKLIFLHSNDIKIRKLIKNLRFERVQSYKNNDILNFIRGLSETIEDKWRDIIGRTNTQNAEHIFSLRKKIYLKREKPLLSNIVEAIQRVKNRNKIVVTVDDISEIIKYTMEKLRDVKIIRESFFIPVKYSDPIKVFALKPLKDVPSFYTIISKYMNRKLEADFTLKNVKRREVFDILNNKLFPRPEKNVIYEGFTRLHGEMIQELRLII